MVHLALLELTTLALFRGSKPLALLRATSKLPTAGLCRAAWSLVARFGASGWADAEYEYLPGIVQYKFLLSDFESV